MEKDERKRERMREDEEGWRRVREVMKEGVEG